MNQTKSSCFVLQETMNKIPEAILLEDRDDLELLELEGKGCTGHAKKLLL